MKSLQALDGYFTKRAQEDKFSGVVRITQGAEEIYAGAFGYASRSWRVPNDLNVRFDTASITKLFTAVAILQLIDQGRLALDTGVIDALNLRDTAISPAVNVYHLLTHTSGIGDDADEEAGEVYADLWKSRPNYAVTETVDFLPQFVHKPPNFAPGQGCRYCNCSFVLLGLLIEQISGQPYRDYVRQRIFAPAAMHDSDFLRMDRVQPRMAEGADPIRNDADQVVGWAKNIYSYPPIGSPDAGAYVTAADLDRFLRAVRAGRLLSSTATDAFFTPQVDYRRYDDWTMMYGFGLWFYVGTDGRVVCCQKEGVNAGVSGMVRYYPDADINVVILSNMEDGAWEPIWTIHERVVDATGGSA